MLAARRFIPLPLHIELVCPNITLSSLVQEILAGSLTRSVMYTGDQECYHASESLLECPRLFYNVARKLEYILAQTDFW